MAEGSALRKVSARSMVNQPLRPPLPPTSSPATSTSDMTRRLMSSTRGNSTASNSLAIGPNNQRRRNSYAATSTFNDEYNAIREEMMLTPSSQMQFLDPASALRRHPSSAGRRQLPPTPSAEDGEADASSSAAGGVESASSLARRRRGSSPRILPTPPPELEPVAEPVSPLSAATPTTPVRQLLSKKAVSTQALCGEGVERRLSSGRKLPIPPPETATSTISGETPDERTLAGDSPHSPLSAAERRGVEYARRKPNSFHQLTRGAPTSVDRVSYAVLESTRHSVDRDNAPLESRRPLQHLPMPPPSIVRPDNTPTTPQTPLTSIASRLEEAEVSSPGGPATRRKFSDAFSDTASNASISLARNGSMAHLLEQQQQQLLRRELCNTTPDSSGNTQSNHSSLSPSVEQLNCAATPSIPTSSGMPPTLNGASGNRSSGSEAGDPSAHGLNPILYGGAASLVDTERSTITSSASCSGVSSWQDNQSARSCSFGGGAGTESVKPRGLGLIHCSLQHFPVRKRIRVSILRIEGLAGELRPELDLQPFCRVNLVPAKHSKYQTSAVKRGRNAVFNAEFFFDNVATEEIEEKSLSVEVCHQSTQKLQKDLEIGEILVPLKDLSQLYSKKEVRILEELKPMISAKKLGRITVVTCIEKEARRLTINIIKVDDLPKWGIIGAPDVCVRITLSQGSSPPQTKSSRVIKNSTSAVYKEAVMFLFSTKASDLQRTKITISVHDISRAVTGNDVIGSVYLGELAVDKSELEQWKNSVEHIGKEIKATHSLKFNRTAPDVHVECADDQSDAADEAADEES